LQRPVSLSLLDTSPSVLITILIMLMAVCSLRFHFDCPTKSMPLSDYYLAIFSVLFFYFTISQVVSFKLEWNNRLPTVIEGNGGSWGMGRWRKLVLKIVKK